MLANKYSRMKDMVADIQIVPGDQKYQRTEMRKQGVVH